MSQQKPLGREGILAFKVKPQIKHVQIDSLGEICIRAIDRGMCDPIRSYEGECPSDVATFIAGVVDESGSPLFSATAEDILEIKGLPPGVINQVVEQVAALNVAKVNEEIKNSPASPKDDSPTDLLPTSEGQ
jgi:hypothetical protein